MFNLFSTRTVASITASLSSMVTQLEAHAEGKLIELEDHTRIVNERWKVIAEVKSEIEAAKTAAKKIAALFS